MLNGSNCNQLGATDVGPVVLFVLTNPGQSVEQVSNIYKPLGVEIRPIDVSTHNVKQASEAISSGNGLLILGGRANVHPANYGESPILIDGKDQPFDRERDDLSRALIHAALANDIPFLGICRGFQELAVALGAKLVQNLADHLTNNPHPFGYTSDDHRERDAHAIKLLPGTFFAKAGLDGSECMVNSVHEQGLVKAPPGTVIEAVCDDVIEAFSVLGHPYARGVQWHPEWRTDAVSQFILSSFFEALLEHHARCAMKKAAPIYPPLSTNKTVQEVTA